MLSVFSKLLKVGDDKQNRQTYQPPTKTSTSGTLSAATRTVHEYKPSLTACQKVGGKTNYSARIAPGGSPVDRAGTAP